MARHIIPPEKLRWKPESGDFPADSTRDIPAIEGTVGQATARSALRFAVLSPGPNQHVFVRGLQGSRRRKVIDSVFRELNPPPRQSRDFCFVHSFTNPDRPRLIVLQGGQGRQFQQHMHRIGLFVKERLPEILDNEPIRGRRESRKVSAEREVRALLRPLEKALEQEGLGLIRSESGPSSRLDIGIKVMGKPVTQEEFRNMVARKQASDDERNEINEKIEKHQPELQRIVRQIRQIWQQTQQHIEQINITESARILGELTSEVTRQFKAEGVESFLRDVIDDVLEKRVGHDTRHLADPTVLYSVKVLKHDTLPERAPVICPSLISAGSLFGSVDPAWRSGERAVASFRGIHAGALIEADGGFLVLDADDLLNEPELFRRLLRTLRTRTVEILAPTPDWSHAAQSLKPEPVPVDCCVVLFGDERRFDELADLNDEFQEQFRIVADLDQAIGRNTEGIHEICALLSAIVEEQSLLPLDRSALSTMVEYSARLADDSSVLAILPSQFAAIVREASFIASEQERSDISREDIEQAITQSRERAALHYSRALNTIKGGRSPIQIRGKSAEQVNAMTLHRNAGRAFALPTQVVVGIAPNPHPEIMLWNRGQGGRPDNSGSALLLPLIARLLRLDQTPDIRATFDFNVLQDITDVESTILAQACALVAALAELPLRQDLAIIGSLDLRGQILPINAINHRVEGFFDVCNAVGISGQQGVIIPKQNAEQLLLDPRVVSACANDTFQVVGAETLLQALSLATGKNAGIWKNNAFGPDTVLGRARENALSLMS